MATRRDEAETRKRSFAKYRIESSLQDRLIIYLALLNEKERQRERGGGKDTFDENIHPRFIRTTPVY